MNRTDFLLSFVSHVLFDDGWDPRADQLMFFARQTGHSFNEKIRSAIVMDKSDFVRFPDSVYSVATDVSKPWTGNDIGEG